MRVRFTLRRPDRLSGDEFVQAVRRPPAAKTEHFRIHVRRRPGPQTSASSVEPRSALDARRQSGPQRSALEARPNGLGRSPPPFRDCPPSAGGSRLGVSVGRKFGKAVARNRFKRLVREAFRTSREVRAAGLDIVVVGKHAGALERPGEIAEALGLASSRVRS